MTASARQHVIASTAILLIALSVAWLSFTQEPADAFLFPRLISVFFVFFAIWNSARAVLGLSKVGEGLSTAPLLNLLPGLAIALLYVFWAAKALGFYLAGTLVFLTIFTIYDPASPLSPRGWARRIVITGAFMLVIYALFALLLKVQTPRGIFI